MPQTHWLIDSVPHDTGTRLKSSAQWSRDPRGGLLIFVHGFGGSAVRTWYHFQSLLDGRSVASGWDVIFFGYDGLHTRSTNSAALLKDFIHEIDKDPCHYPDRMLAPPCRAPRPDYQHIVIVAHSLGAIVARDAMCQGLDDKQTWPEKTSLLLFAPAHCGAVIEQLVREALPGVLAKLQAVYYASGKYKVLRDLKQGCATLRGLRKRVKRYLKLGKKSLGAQLVVNALDDRVVEPGRFVAADRSHTPMPGDHTSICKPTDAFIRPVDVVCEVLKRCQPV